MSRTLVRLILLGYPASLRREFGPEVVEVFAARLSDARRRGNRAVVWLWAREALDGMRRRLRAGPDPAFDPPPGQRIPDRPSPGERLMHALDLFWQDTRFAARTLRQAPGFALAAILVLALGIGANTAIFSVVHAVLLAPLPFADADRLVAIFETNPERGWVQAQVAAANYLDWRERSASFEDIAAHNDWLSEVAWMDGGEPRALRANSVTGNWFDLLGVEMAAGTGFAPADDWSGGEAKVVLSHALWTQRFAGDPAVVGTRMDIDGVPRTIVGVAPQGFAYPFAGVDLWGPVAWSPDRRAEVSFRRAHGMRAIGRLAPGVDEAAAAAELAAIAVQLEAEYPETNTTMGTTTLPVREWIVGDTRTPVLVLFAAVGLVLMVACANVANMQLARASRRGREMALRAAVGASRGRLLRQGLTESLLLAVAGGVGGVAVGTLILMTLRRSEVEALLPFGDLRLDPAVLSFTCAVTLATGVVFGLVPALRAARRDAARSLSATRTTGGPESPRTAMLLVAAEIALVLPLVIGSGLLVRSMVELRDVDPGFVADGVTVFEYSLPRARYETGTTIADFHRALNERVAALPGIDAAGIGTRMPYRNQRWSSDFRIESWVPDRYGIGVRHDEIAGDLFGALDVPLRGRNFDEQLGSDRLLAIVNQAFVDRYLDGRDPIGERLCNERAAEDCRFWFEIVGVAGNVRRESLALEEEPSIYAYILKSVSSTARLYVRSSLAADVVVEQVRGAFRELDPALPLSDIVALEALVSESLGRLRMLLRLLGGFAALALVLAALGVYGVVAYVTARRTREIGVRVTLGAAPGDVVRGVLGRGLLPVAIGIALGLALAVASGRLLGEFLFGVAPADPITYGTAVGVLAATAAAACLVPARRALRVDPVEALRQD